MYALHSRADHVHVSVCQAYTYAGCLLRPMGTDEARMTYMTNILGVPPPVQANVMIPAAKK